MDGQRWTRWWSALVLVGCSTSEPDVTGTTTTGADETNGTPTTETIGVVDGSSSTGAEPTTTMSPTTTVDPTTTTDPTTGPTTTTDPTGEDTTTGAPICEVMLPPPGDCPENAAPGGQRFAPATTRYADFDDVAALPDEVQGGFIPPPDAGGAPIECDLFAQDCGPDEKCMPWANDGGNSWNATRCSPLDPNPVGIGDGCTVEGSGVSGIDNCDGTSMCFDVDGETNMGTCVELCTCSAVTPICNTPNTQCAISNEGALALCLAVCNPLDPTGCPDGQGCYGVNDTFQCAPDASGDQGAPGDECAFLNACDPGSFCANAESVPGCQNFACCSPFCTLGDGSSCLANQGCQAWFAEGKAPDDCLATIGACITE